MGRKKVFGSKPYVKTDLNQLVDSAITKIHEKVGTSKADIVRIALYDYIKKNYPEFLK